MARRKNPAAVALGRLGGKKGGRARAESLTAEERKRIASAAGKARLSKLSPAQRKKIAKAAAKARWST